MEDHAGSDQSSGNLFSYVDLEERVPDDHPLRLIREIVRRIGVSIFGVRDALFPHGSPIDPAEKLLRASLLQVFYSIRSERPDGAAKLQHAVSLVCGAGLTMARGTPRVLPQPGPSSGGGGFAPSCLRGLSSTTRYVGLLSRDHFSVDGTLIEAWASMKSFRPKGEDDGDNGSGRRRAGFSWRETPNATHASSLIRTPGFIARVMAGKASCVTWAMR